MNLNAWHIYVYIYIYNIYVKTHGKAGVNITCLASGGNKCLGIEQALLEFHFHNCRKFSGTNTISAA